MWLKKKKAFTIVEMIAAISMFMIISLTAISMFTFVVKLNAINRKTYDADIYSKAFFETIKAYKPKVGEKANEGYYLYTFNNVSEIETFAKGIFNVTAPKVSEYGYILAKQQATANNKNIAMEIKINYQGNDGSNVVINPSISDNVKAENLFEIEVWVWDVTKGEVSRVNRKTIISPEGK